jgi:hypothetical protein
MEIVYAHLSKNGCQTSGFLADPDLTDTVLNEINTNQDQNEENKNNPKHQKLMSSEMFC